VPGGDDRAKVGGKWSEKDEAGQWESRIMRRSSRSKDQEREFLKDKKK